MGWRLLHGTHSVRLPGNSEESITLTIKTDTGRVTRYSNEQIGNYKIVFIGGSFTMGFGLNDEQTCAWKIQQKFKHKDIRNLGVGAYGTYQSLMVLESELKKKRISPNVSFTV